MPHTRLVFVLALLAAGAALATRGAKDPTVTLNSLSELWSDTLRDTDQIGMKVTRLSDAGEMRIGAELAQSDPAAGLAPPAEEAYVNSVGQTVAQHVRRRAIRYRFHVVNSPMIDAFALPGGQVFVTSGMLEFVVSEAELAAILGHEIAHVDLRHCIERYQYEIRLRQAGMPEAGQLAETAHRLATFPFASYQELDADAQGERMSIESGYDPAAAPRLFERLTVRLAEPLRVQAATPAGEVTQSAGEAIDSFLRSHPPSQERARDLDALVARNRTAFQGKPFYAGRQNLRDRVPKSVREYPAERVTF